MNPSQEENQQELPPWRSEQPTLAGPNPSGGSYPQPSPLNDPKPDDKCCIHCTKKCGPIGWYFSPILDKLGYSLLTTFYHILMFPYTLGVFIAVVTLWSVSVGLLVLVFGFILYWITCEISVVFARIDLALAYYFVEDNEELISQRGRSLRLSLYKEMGPCPCNSSQSFCDSMWTRMKSLMIRCDMYKIFLFQMIFKPIIVGLTWWICIIVIYNIGCVFAPIVYISYPPVFTKHYWCPFGDMECNDGHCKCHVVSVDDFWGALLFGLVSLLLLPITFRVSIWFAKASKATSYLFLSDHYKKNKDEDRSGLLAVSSKKSSKPVRDVSISLDGHKPTPAGTNHSLNNTYMDTQV